MTLAIASPPPLQINLDEDQVKNVAWILDNLPVVLSSTHCTQARAMLGWSIETLAFRSGVSPEAIRRLETGTELREVTLQALAFTLEAEGLIFFPGHEPMRGENCRGATKHPRTRDDFHLIE